MQQQLAESVFVDSGSAQVSQAVSMAGASGVSVSGTVLESLESGVVAVVLQESNDLENWTTETSSSMRISAPGYSTFQITGIGMAFVRLRYSIVSGGAVVLEAKLNTAKV